MGGQPVLLPIPKGGLPGLPFPQKLKIETGKGNAGLRLRDQYEHCTVVRGQRIASFRSNGGLKPAPRARRAARGACCALAARRVGTPSASHAVSGGDLWASVEDCLATRGIILGQVRAQSPLNLLRLATRRGYSRGQNRACIALRDVLVLHIICPCVPRRKRRAHSRQAPPVLHPTLLCSLADNGRRAGCR